MKNPLMDLHVVYSVSYEPKPTQARFPISTPIPGRIKKKTNRYTRLVLFYETQSSANIRTDLRNDFDNYPNK